jgi:radical SAM protein with 4Fe4S-binding SPASM domain
MLRDFYDCEKELLQFHLNEEIFPPQLKFRSLLFSNDHLVHPEYSCFQGIELIVRPECNQQCEYCYIARHGKELYPMNERVSRDKILSNLRILLNYIFNEKEVYIKHFELFAGDMFFDDLFFDVLDVFYEVLKPNQEKYPAIFANNEGIILTPCNFAFIDDDKKAARLDDYVQKFRNELNWDIGMSISTDGKYATDTREGRDVEDEHFDKLFEFTLKYRKVGFHPIISASNVKNAIKNYDWWKEQYQRFYDIEHHDFLPYWLEARNDDWDEETIAEFIKLLDHMIKDRLAMCDNDIDKLAYHLLVGDGAKGTLPKMTHGDLLNIRLLSGAVAESSACSLSGLACFTLNNLALVPCHRLTYKQFRGGYLKTDGEKVIDIEPYNPGGYLNIIKEPADTLPLCGQCPYNELCHKGCLGAQFEASGEVFQPCLSVCQLLKEMFGFLITTYAAMGVFESGKRQNIISDHALEVYEGMGRYYKNMMHDRMIAERGFN